MDKKQRRRLKTLLAGLDAGERDRLIKRATKMQKVAMRTRTQGARRPEVDEFLVRLLDPEAGAEAAGTQEHQAVVGVRAPS